MREATGQICNAMFSHPVCSTMEGQDTPRPGSGQEWEQAGFFGRALLFFALARG
jgi:hypothetical protein